MGMEPRLTLAPLHAGKVHRWLLESWGLYRLGRPRVETPSLRLSWNSGHTTSHLCPVRLPWGQCRASLGCADSDQTGKSTGAILAFASPSTVGSDTLSNLV